LQPDLDSNMTTAWEHFAHGADIGVRGIGPTKAAAFEQAALALTGVICDPSLVRATESVAIRCESSNDELLLVDWLNEIILEMAVRHMLFGAYDVRIAGAALEATAWGEPIDADRHQPAVEVKGATLTELRVRQQLDGWLAQCVVDV
jgi:tRNA nucleotidyltransferase (CCA-adding enzyme)